MSDDPTDGVGPDDPGDNDDDNGHGDHDHDGHDHDGHDHDDVPLDERETELVRQDLHDLADFASTFRDEGYRGVAVFCHDCVEEHFYPWDMLRENLELLLETGETPVHEPAYAPEPHRYVPWDYARGYVDALRDTGVELRRDAEMCPRCALELPETARTANFCPRCATPLFTVRLADALEARGLAADVVTDILRETGFPG